jgi:hypothetical protein
MGKVLVRLRRVLEIIFGKRPGTTIVVIDFAEPKYVMITNTRNKSYASKKKYDPPRTCSIPSSTSPTATLQVTKTPDSQGTPSPLLSSKYNILNELNNIKVDATLLDMVVAPEQQKHMKNFMDGKTSTIANIYEEVNGEDSSVNKLGVNNFRHPVKKSPIFHLCKFYGQNIPLLSD